MIDWGIGVSASASGGICDFRMGFLLFCAVHTHHRHTFMVQHIIYMYLSLSQRRRKECKKKNHGVVHIRRVSALRPITLYVRWSISKTVVLLRCGTPSGCCPGAPHRSFDMPYKSQDLTHAGRWKCVMIWFSKQPR